MQVNGEGPVTLEVPSTSTKLWLTKDMGPDTPRGPSCPQRAHPTSVCP